MVALEVFGIGGGELLLLLVLGVIMFGPEKLPQVSRKVAHVVHFVRVFANQATAQLREELGPEYKDLKLTDLNPKTLVRKTLLADIEGDLDDIKRELDGVKSDLNSSAADIADANADVKNLAGVAAGGAEVGAALIVPWDSEAT